MRIPDSLFIERLDAIIEREIPLLSEYEIKIAARKRSVLIRMLVAEALAYYSTNIARDILITLISDKNTLVRSAAAISMKYHVEPGTIAALNYSFFHDTSPMVRGYAGDSLIHMIEYDTDAISNITLSLSQERNLWVRTLCYGALYQVMQKKEYLLEIAKGFNSKKYRIRCAAANVLLEVLNYSNATDISQIITPIVQMEETPAVKSTLENIICKIQNSKF